MSSLRTSSAGFVAGAWAMPGDRLEQRDYARIHLVVWYRSGSVPIERLDLSAEPLDQGLGAFLLGHRYNSAPIARAVSVAFGARCSQVEKVEAGSTFRSTSAASQACIGTPAGAASARQARPQPGRPPRAGLRVVGALAILASADTNGGNHAQPETQRHPAGHPQRRGPTRRLVAPARAQVGHGQGRRPQGEPEEPARPRPGRRGRGRRARAGLAPG